MPKGPDAVKVAGGKAVSAVPAAPSFRKWRRFKELDFITGLNISLEETTYCDIETLY
jgi:hypothetical protein